jgi:hypothetical protein
VLEALTPVMSATTLVLSLATEGLWESLPGSPYFDGPGAVAGSAGLVFVGANIAFFMVWAEYEVRVYYECECVLVCVCACVCVCVCLCL